MDNIPINQHLRNMSITLLPRRYGGQRGFAAPAGRLSLRRAASHGRFREWRSLPPVIHSRPL